MLRARRFAPLACTCLLLACAAAAATAKPVRPPVAAPKPAPIAAPAKPDTLRPLPAPGRLSAPAPTPGAAAGADREGRGEREMVLIHGLGSSAEVWDRVLPQLSRSYRVWLYELPGHGRTPPIPRLTINTAAEDLGRFLKANDIVQPVLVGHAMGGLIAMRYAFDHPAEVKRLVIIDATPRQMATDEEKAGVVEQLLHNYDAFIAGRYAAMSPDSSITRRLVDQALKTDRPSLTSLLMSSFKFDLTEELPRQAIPILLVASAMMLPSADNVGPQLDAYGFSDARTISFKRVERTGHFVMLEQPDFLASIISAWCLQH